MALAWAVSAQAIEIPHEVHQLDNGLEVVLLEDHRLPKVVVDTWYDVGSYDDPDGRSGFAHLFEHLMFKGTPRVPEGEFDLRMEAAGGWNNASTDDWRTNYYDVAPASALNLLLWLEADRMTGLDITQDKLDVEREVVRNERRQNYEDRPYGGIWLELPPALYPADNPLHRSGIGNHEELMASTVEDVQAFYDTWYVPSNAVLCIAGDFDREATLAWVDQTFGTLPVREAPSRELAPIPPTPAKDLVVLEDQVTLPQSNLVWKGPAAYQPGDFERDVLSMILAGPGGRLVRRLVHEDQLAVEVDAAQFSARWDSIFFVDLRVAPGGDLEAAEAAVLDELAGLAGDRPPTQAEVDRAVRQLLDAKLEGLQDLRARAEQLQHYRMLTGRYDYLEDELAAYNAITVEAVADTAASIATGSYVRLHVVPAEGGE